MHVTNCNHAKNDVLRTGLSIGIHVFLIFHTLLSLSTDLVIKFYEIMYIYFYENKKMIKSIFITSIFSYSLYSTQVRLPSLDGRVALVPWADMLNHSCEVCERPVSSYMHNIKINLLEHNSNFLNLYLIGEGGNIFGLREVNKGSRIYN